MEDLQKCLYGSVYESAACLRKRFLVNMNRESSFKYPLIFPVQQSLLFGSLASLCLQYVG